MEEPTPAAGYIFVCSNLTERECFARRLFGTDRHGELVSAIRKGETLYLFNYTRRSLYGRFTAARDGGPDLVADAWSGAYPFQVKVEIPSIGMFEVTRLKLDDLIPFESPSVPYVALSAKARDTLDALIESKGRPRADL